MDLLDRFRGSIVGLAIGDALGHPTEFVGEMKAIRARWGEAGVTGFEPAGRHPAGTFTDDTQMSIAVTRALARAGHQDLERLMTVMASEFVAWSRSPDNDRSPGGACMRGCRELENGAPWRHAGVGDSKGCGAAMRAAPIGLYLYDDVERLILVAAAQSTLTHRHPTGVASSVAAAAAVAHVLKTGSLDGILDFTRDCVAKLSHEILLGVGCDERLAREVGLREMQAMLDRTERALGEETDDVCTLLGGAWIGEEAVATALWCVLRAGGDYRDAVLRGANSTGDSDSIACIAGSIAGALAGWTGLPDAWRRDVEKADTLVALADALFSAHTRGDEESMDASLDPFGAQGRRVAGAQPGAPGA